MTLIELTTSHNCTINNSGHRQRTLFHSVIHLLLFSNGTQFNLRQELDMLNIKRFVFARLLNVVLSQNVAQTVNQLGVSFTN